MFDRYGFRPQYRNGDQVSSALLNLPRAGLDYDALSVFIRLGFFIGNMTAFKDIKHVGPEPWITRLNQMSRESAIDLYGDLFRSAVRKMMPDGDIVLPLSGGQDSRHILLELIEAGTKPLAVTLQHWPPVNDDDLRIARMLADGFGLEHVVIPATWRKVRAECDGLAITDFCSEELAWTLPMRAFMQRHSGTAFDGIAGDVLSAGLYLHKGLLAAMERGDTATAADLLLGSEDMWQSILDPSLYQKLSRESASALLQEELRKHLNAPNPVSSYLFWN